MASASIFFPTGGNFCFLRGFEGMTSKVSVLTNLYRTIAPSLCVTHIWGTNWRGHTYCWRGKGRKSSFCIAQASHLWWEVCFKFFLSKYNVHNSVEEVTNPELESIKILN